MNLAKSLNRRKKYILSLKTILLCFLAMSISIVGRSGFSHADEQIYYKPLSARAITKEEAKANSAGKIILISSLFKWLHCRIYRPIYSNIRCAGDSVFSLCGLYFLFITCFISHYFSLYSF